ncbi:hypothetical protein BD410DRAFT_620601 [Rickenella mellea]|uniref:Uncharacterized protein n=1 Tax=Rickenella mellea TaxID=50990 RepID=A0A4Y7PM53_9AGAM|nr:hypothetical protein BD410DRAFT_620601 [Rickenella mellea]
MEANGRIERRKMVFGQREDNHDVKFTVVRRSFPSNSLCCLVLVTCFVTRVHLYKVDAIIGPIPSIPYCATATVSREIQVKCVWSCRIAFCPYV